MGVCAYLLANHNVYLEPGSWLFRMLQRGQATLEPEHWPPKQAFYSASTAMIKTLNHLATQKAQSSKLLAPGLAAASSTVQKSLGQHTVSPDHSGLNSEVSNAN